MLEIRLLSVIGRRARRVAALPLLLLGCAKGIDEPVDIARLEAPLVLEPTPPGTPLAIPLSQANDPLLANLTPPADAPTKGMWSQTQAWPLNGLHSVLLPNGRVLTYGTPTGNAATQDGRYFDVWDPAQGFGAASHQTSFKTDQVNSFCSSSAFLQNGTLLVSGGNSPLGSSEFAAASAAIVSSPSMLADERWYGSMLTLADGRPLMVGGSTPYGALRAYQDPGAAVNAGTISMTPEVYEVGTGWRSLFGAYSRAAFGPDFHRYWYPRGWVSPVTGEVFGISSETMWFLNPSGDGAVRVAGAFKAAANDVTRPNIGPTSSAVLFAPGRILQVGGNGYHDGHDTPSSALATVIDINSGEPLVSETAPMNFARQWPSATVLPDGRVLVTGGTRRANNGGADAVYEAELWAPNTGSWQVGARAAQIRVYHSAAILMPNGTLLSTGGGAPGPVNNLNAELYYPPYLFRSVAGAVELAPRPILSGINSLKFSYGQFVELDLRDASNLERVVLIGTSQVTHSFNTSQRYQPLDFTQSAGRVTATLPTSAFQAPPGYYQLVVVDAGGVPSSAVIVALGADTAAPPVPTALPRNSQVTLASVNNPDYTIASDATGLGVLKFLGTNPSAADLASAQFVVRDGLSDTSCASFESVGTPGRWLRHAAFRLQLSANDGSALFKGDATFCPEAGLAGTGISLRSKNYPANLVRHRDLQIWLDPAPVPPLSFSADASFTVTVSAFPALPSISAPILPAGGTATYAPVINAPGAQYSWDFGDGSAPTTFAATASTSHPYPTPGSYLVTLTVRLSDGRSTTKTFVQAVYASVTSTAPRASSALTLEARGTAAARLWLVNPDNNSVAVFDTGTNARVAEVAVGQAPRSVAVAPDGRVWVVNRDSASISIISPSSLTVAQTVALPRASQPYGLVFAPNGSAAFVAHDATGQVSKLNVSTGARLATASVGANPRQLSVSADSSRVLVSRFVTPPVNGESTQAVPSTGSGQVLLLNPSAMTVSKTIPLAYSTRVDSEVQARGVPNYLGAPLVAPDGRSAWVPSKQDNITRGSLRDGQNLDFQDTVRAISSRIDLDAQLEDSAGRIDHDNSSLASAAAFHPTGAYLFVALETSRQVAVVAAVPKRELFRIDVGRAPQALVVSANGARLYVQNFMDRTLGVFDLQPLVGFGEFRAPVLATLSSIATERLAAQVLLGKQLFYDARDPRLARDAYLSCASCHNDGGHDGRVWDLGGMGEGLRNTISLRGRSGGQSLLHWSGNFDEVQDFEGQIRTLSGGTGLMSDADFTTGTRSQPLGDPKAGRSTDLDALAAYVKSLNGVGTSPFRNGDGTLTTAAVSGRQVFATSGCPQCHNGSTFADEGQTALRNIGTLKAASGNRLGGTLAGIDPPSLRDAWSSAPYLHDGSAATLAQAISAHNTVTLSATNLGNVAAFVQQIEASEPGFAPASGLTNCASENATCTIPAGRTATVYYGANTRFFSKQGVAGSIACNNATFGDPVKSTRKSCSYR